MLTGISLRFMNAKIDKKVDQANCDIHVRQLDQIAKDTAETKITVAVMASQIENIEKAVNKS